MWVRGCTSYRPTGLYAAQQSVQQRSLSGGSRSVPIGKILYQKYTCPGPCQATDQAVGPAGVTAAAGWVQSLRWSDLR
jgi:hypothetical protein